MLGLVEGHVSRRWLRTGSSQGARPAPVTHSHLGAHHHAPLRSCPKPQGRVQPLALNGALAKLGSLAGDLGLERR